jgi:RecA/RadA recombinase
VPVRPEDYDEIVKRISRKYDGDLRRGNEMESADRISTGSLELDVATGGGIPQGRWSRFYGNYSSTKTLTAYRVIAQAQRLGLSCAYYNVEKQYHPKFVERWDVDSKELTVVEGTTIEEIGDKMEALFGVVHLHVVDSCSMAESEDALNADIRDWRPGINARAWGKVFRRLNERFDQHENTVILLDHVTINFQTGSEVAKGGKIFDHQSSLSIMFRKGKWLHRDSEGVLSETALQRKGSDGQMEPAGIAIACRVEKSRVCRPFRTATRHYDMDNYVFDDVFEYIKAAKHYGIVRPGKGNGRWEYGPEDNPVKLYGDKQLREWIKADLTLQEEIRDRAMAASQR